MTEYVVQIFKDSKWQATKKSDDISGCSKIAETLAAQFPSLMVRVIESYHNDGDAKQRWRPRQVFNEKKAQETVPGDQPPQSPKITPNDASMIASSGSVASSGRTKVGDSDRPSVDDGFQALDASSDSTFYYVLKVFVTGGLYSAFWLRRISTRLNHLLDPIAFSDKFILVVCCAYIITAIMGILQVIGILGVKYDTILALGSLIWMMVDRVVATNGVTSMRQFNKYFGDDFITRGSKLWCWCLGTLYMNYKINSACDKFKLLRTGTIALRA